MPCGVRDAGRLRRQPVTGGARGCHRARRAERPGRTPCGRRRRAAGANRSVRPPGGRGPVRGGHSLPCGPTPLPGRGPRTGRPRPALRACAVASANRPARRNGPERGPPPHAGRPARPSAGGSRTRPGRCGNALRGPGAGRRSARDSHGSGPGPPGRRGARGTPCGPQPGAGAIRRPAACGAPSPRRTECPRSSAAQGRGRAGARLGAPRAAGPAAHRGRARGRVARLRLRPSPASTRPRPPRSSRRPRTRRRPPRRPSPQRKA